MFVIRKYSFPPLYQFFIRVNVTRAYNNRVETKDSANLQRHLVPKPAV